MSSSPTRIGKPVNGLTEKDFQVFEDGKLQRIRSLEPPSAHTLPPASMAAGAAAVFDPAQPASFGHSPVEHPRARPAEHALRRQLFRAPLPARLSRRPACAAAAAHHVAHRVRQPASSCSQNFTRDRDALLRALAAAPTKYAWKLEVNGKTDHGPVERLDQSLRALEEIAQSYARIPGRKNLIWVGGGFPTLDPEASTATMRRRSRTRSSTSRTSCSTRASRSMPIDPTSLPPGMTEITDASQMAFVAGGRRRYSPAGSTPSAPREDFDQLGPRHRRPRRPRHATTSPSRLLRPSIWAQTSTPLSYTPSSTSEAAAQYRTIKWSACARASPSSTRNGYYSGQSQQEKSVATAAYDLTTAAEGVDAAQRPSRHRRAGQRCRRSAQTYIVRAGAANLTWKPKGDGGATASVYIMAVSLDAKKKMLGHTLHGMTANAKPEAPICAIPPRWPTLSLPRHLCRRRQHCASSFATPPPAAWAPSICR